MSLLTSVDRISCNYQLKYKHHSFGSDSVFRTSWGVFFFFCWSACLFSVFPIYFSFPLLEAQFLIKNNNIVRKQGPKLAPSASKGYLEEKHS